MRRRRSGGAHKPRNPTGAEGGEGEREEELTIRNAKTLLELKKRAEGRGVYPALPRPARALGRRQCSPAGS